MSHSVCSRNDQNWLSSVQQDQFNGPIQRSPQQQNNNDTQDIIQKLCDQTWKALQQLHGKNTLIQDRSTADQFLSKHLPNQPCCWQIFSRFIQTDKLPHAAHFFAAVKSNSKIILHI